MSAHDDRRRSRRNRVLVLALLAVLGFGISVTIRTSRSTSGLAGARQTDLVRILDGLDLDSDRLRAEIERLEGTRSQLAVAPDPAAAVDEARSQAEDLEILVGVAPAQGSGVALSITDPQGTVGPEVLVDALQELRDAGAEAMQLSGVRVVASTSVVARAGGGLTVDGTAVLPPYELLALGDGHTLAQAMRIPGGVLDAVRSRAGADAEVVTRERIEIRAARALPTPRYARPAG